MSPITPSSMNNDQCAFSSTTNLFLNSLVQSYYVYVLWFSNTMPACCRVKLNDQYYKPRSNWSTASGVARTIRFLKLYFNLNRIVQLTANLHAWCSHYQFVISVWSIQLTRTINGGDFGHWHGVTLDNFSPPEVLSLYTKNFLMKCFLLWSSVMNLCNMIISLWK